MRVAEIPHLSELSVSEKILLVEDLWDSISSDETAVPVPKSHKRELDERFKRHEKGIGKLLSIEELREEVESRR